MENIVNTVRVLVLQSSDTFVNMMIDLLKRNNYIVDTCDNNIQFLEYIYNNLYDLYLIDINEPSYPKFELIQLLNDYKDMTMKMAIASLPNIVKPSFLHGCDECILKNIDENELLFRIKALIRRQYKVHKDTISLRDNIHYNIFNKSLFINNKEVFLSEKPLHILEHLLKFDGYFVSSEEIEKNIYPANSDDKSGVIRYHVHKIRQVLGDDIIVSNRTKGYKLLLK